MQTKPVPALLTALLFMLSLPLQSQNLYQKSYDLLESERFHNITASPLGGYILATITWDVPNTQQVGAIKVDAQGNILRKTGFARNHTETIASAYETADTCTVLGGTVNNLGTGDDFYLLKADTAGQLLWQYSYGSSAFERMRVMIPTLDGGALLVGERNVSDLAVVKVDGSGNLQWGYRYPLNYNQPLANRAVQLVDSSYIVGGGGGHMLRLSKTGAILWQWRYDIPSNLTFELGNFWEIKPNRIRCVGGSGSRAFFMSIDSLGNIISARIAPAQSSVFFAGTEFPSGDFLLSGRMDGDHYLARFDSSSNLTWDKWYGNGQLWHFYQLLAMPAEGALLAGFTVVTGSDGLLMRVDAQGSAGGCNSAELVRSFGPASPTRTALSAVPVADFTRTSSAFVPFAIPDSIIILCAATVNHPPVLQPTTSIFNVFEHCERDFCFLASDPDLPNDQLTPIAILAGPAHGIFQFTMGNCYNYTPDQGYVGLDSVLLAVCDTAGLCDTLNLVLQVIPQSIHLGADTTLIAGDSLLLDPGGGYTSYLWQNGDTIRTHLVTTTGLYWVEVELGACTVRDTIMVNVITSPEPPEPPVEFTVYPNPTTGKFRIDLAGTSGFEVEVCDMLGHAIYTGKTPDQRFAFDISSLPAGTYFLRLQTQDRRYTRKIIHHGKP